MIVEYRSYRLHPGRLADYLELFAKQAGALALLQPQLAGFWVAESGVLNTVHHLWRYESRQARAGIRSSIAKNPVMPGFFAAVTPFIQSQTSTIFEGELPQPRSSDVHGCYDRIGISLHPDAEPAAVRHVLQGVDRAVSGFTRVATLRRGWIETSGPVVQALYMVRSATLSEREVNLQAASDALGAAARGNVIAAVDHGLMYPVAFSPWR